MNITPTEAVERLAWRFNQNKTFTPNQNDANALNTLIDYFNNENKKVSHLPFAKLFLLTFHDYLPHFGEEKTLEKINKVLTEDIGVMYAKLKDRLNTFDLDAYFKAKGIFDANMYECATIDELRLKTAENKEKLKSINIQEFKQVSDGYKIDDVIENMNALINHYIRQHS